MACKIEGEKNQDDHAYARGVIAPALTVGPNWKTSYKRDDYHYEENEQECHGLRMMSCGQRQNSSIQHIFPSFTPTNVLAVGCDGNVNVRALLELRIIAMLVE